MKNSNTASKEMTNDKCKNQGFFSLFHFSFLLTLTLFLALTPHTHAQILGSREPGEQLPHEVKPADLAGSAYGGDVNLFTGSYAGTYSLGSVSTPGGLSYTLQLQYSSALSAGTDVPIARGIPYGEGWSLSLPTISVSSEAYRTFGETELCQYFSQHNYDTLSYNLNEGDLYWFAPYVSIPGVASGRAVYKYTDQNDAVFVLNTFERYVELRLNGNTWTLTTDDGHVYRFGLAKTSYRSASNKRNFDYTTGLQPNQYDATMMNLADAGNLKNQLIPKGEFLSWYCTEIRHNNLPGGQIIRFYYDQFGTFNFFKEYSENWQADIAAGMHEELDQMPFNIDSIFVVNQQGDTVFDHIDTTWIGSPFNLPDLEVSTDIFLTEVISGDQWSLIDKIVLEYGTHDQFGVDMLDHSDADVFRLDSLYSFKSVYYQGIYDSGNGLYDPVDPSPSLGWGSWNRYMHTKHKDVQLQGFNNYSISTKNPYQGINSNTAWYFEKPLSVGSGNGLAFDHGYLESPRIGGTMGGQPGEKIIPGDYYEIRTILSTHNSDTGAVNIDINLASGVYNNPSNFTRSASNNSTFDRVRVNDGPGATGKYPTVKETVFSTFGNALKWNIRGNNSGTSYNNTIVTSNLFSMPNLPENYEGFHIQVGPAGADMMYDTPLLNIKHNTLTGKPNAYHAYDARYATIPGGSFMSSPLLKTIEPIPPAFGTGVPWWQMRYVADHALNTIDPSSNSLLYRFWWNHETSPTEAWPNKPTLADDGVKLNAVELIRYSKNPYVLQGVKTYKINGEINGITDPGLVQTGALELDYEVLTDTLLDNRHYPVIDTNGNTAPPVFSQQRFANIYVLKNITNIPTNPSENDPQNVTYTPGQTPTVHFDYVFNRNTTYGGDFFRLNSGGVLLNKITNHLGGETRIEYYPLDNSQTTLQGRNTGKQVCPGGSTPTMGAQGAVDVSFSVKRITIEADGADQHWDYTYSNRVFENQRPMLDGDHFSNYRLNYQYGFLETEVTHPIIGGSLRPTTTYKHLSTTHLFGKMSEIFKRDDAGNLQEHTVYEYQAGKAYENGYNRTEAYYSTLSYDYKDYEFGYSPVGAEVDGLEFGVVESPSFYEDDPLFTLPNTTYMDSYFTKKVKETTTRYDRNTCYTPFTPPIGGYNGHVNTNAHNPTIWQMLDDGITTGLEDSLITHSPLSDSILLKMLATETPLSNSLIENVFTTQEDLSDTVLIAMMDRQPEVAEATISNVLTSLPFGRSDKVLVHVMNRNVATTTTLRDVLLVQPSLTDHVLISFINHSPAFDADLLETVLVNREDLSDSTLSAYINLGGSVSDTALENIITNARPFPGDQALLTLLYRTSPGVSESTLKNILIASPYAISDTVDTSMFLRSPAISNQSINAIRTAQAGQSDYATYLNNLDSSHSNSTLALEGYTNNVSNTGASSIALLDTINSAALEAEIESALVLNAPLSDTVLHEMLDHSPKFSDDMLKDILMDQPGVSDTILQNFITTSGVHHTKVRDVLLAQPPTLSEAVLDDFAAQGFNNNTVFAVMLRQAHLPEAVLLSYANSTRPMPDANLEALLVRQPSVTDTILKASLLHSPQLSSTVLTSLLLKQPQYPSDDVLLTLLGASAAFPEDGLRKVLTSTTDTLSSAVQTAIDNYTPALSSETTGAIDYAQLRQNVDTSLAVYCENDQTSPVLQMAQVNEYTYYEANEKGYILSEAYNKLMGKDYFSFQLKWEPSWQLFRAKSYSPQVPGAFSQEEYFYYYDLKNRYYRHDANMINGYSIFGNSYYDSNSVSSAIPRPIGMLRAQEHNLRSIAFQQRSSSKNANSDEAIVTNAYFVWDSDWNEPADANYLEVDITNNDTSCVAPGGGGGGGGGGQTTPFQDSGCVAYKYLGPNYFPNVPYGWAVYQVIFPVNIPGYYVCPCEALDENDSTSLVYSYPECGVLKEPDSLIQQLPVYANPLNDYLLHRSTVIQSDTIEVDPGYSIFKHDDYNILEFENYVPNWSVDTLTQPVFPYDTIEVYRVLERNRYGQVQLEQDEKGLKTRYDYSGKTYVWYKDSDCHYNSYSGVIANNIGVPNNVTVGVGLPDSLLTQFDYHPNYSINTIEDPNGMMTAYSYDDYGRLDSVARNGIPVSKNDYSTWDNTFADNFDERGAKNYVESILFNNDNQPEAERSRAWLDPLGREYHAASQVSPDGNSGTLHTDMTHTGKILYDTWNRTDKSYKPFVYDPFGGTLVDFAIRTTSTNTQQYPNVFQTFEYEEDHFSRPLKQAKYGQNIDTGKTVRYSYELVNAVCMLCELNLTDPEIFRLMPNLPEDYVFERVEVQDEDDKTTVTFTNALGQQVATKSSIDNQTDAVTLFIYDDHGNLSGVINPEKQESRYKYNLMGWLYEKQTVDGGSTRYQYNRSGQVALEQDANGAAGETVIVNTDTSFRQYYRRYHYDEFGRMIQQERITAYGNKGLQPLRYREGLYGLSSIGDTVWFQDSLDAWRYHFTNNHTIYEKAMVQRWSQNGLVDEPLTNQLALPLLEKRWFYNKSKLDSTANSQYFLNHTGLDKGAIHQSQWWWLMNNRQHMRGKLGHALSYADDNWQWHNQQRPVEATYYSYNEDGEPDWMMRQFNPNRIQPNAKGLLARIDYPDYNTRGSLLTMEVDINNDMLLDLQYHYAYDGRNRIKEVYANFDQSEADGNLLAKYAYNDAYGLVTETVYHKNCSSYSPGNDSILNNPVDTITYTYDTRDRMTQTASRFFTQSLYYDGNSDPLSANDISGDLNYNGNINGTTADYTLGSANNAPQAFEQSTYYAYTYDGINRLTKADGAVTDYGSGVNPVYVVDGNYTYDRIGNLLNLDREIMPGVNPAWTQAWAFTYLNGNNRLVQALGANGNTANRLYTYDAAGNVLTDDSRHMDSTNYGRANLPFTVNQSPPASPGTETDYLYDLADGRVWKQVTDYNRDHKLNPVMTREYYLRDAAGNSIGILNANAGDWTWYVFGRERFARLRPDTNQQPDFYPHDLGNSLILDSSIVQGDYAGLNTQLTGLGLNGPEDFPVNLVELQFGDSSWGIFTEQYAQDTVANNPSLDVTVTHPVTLTGWHQAVGFEDSNGESKFPPLSDVLATSSGNGLQLPGGGLPVDTTDTNNNEPPFTLEWSYHNNLQADSLIYYIYDHLGNTRVTYSPKLTNCGWYWDYQIIDGVIVDSTWTNGTTIDYTLENVVDYYPYGKVLREYKNGEEKYLTTYHQRDEETGLDYRGARYYDADVPRFFSLDPLQEKFASWSPYNYVLGNPVIFIDPDGREVSIVFSKTSNKLYVIDLDHYEESLPVKMVSAENYQLGGIRDAEGNLTHNQVLVIDNVFSGGESDANGNIVRDPNEPEQLAIPNGDYDLLEYEASDERHEGWFKLDPIDSDRYDDELDNDTDVNSDGEKRNGFRLHLGSLSWGCVTVCNNPDMKERADIYNVLVSIINNTSSTTVPKREGNQRYIPGTTRKKYGNVTVTGTDTTPEKKDEE